MKKILLAAMLSLLLGGCTWREADDLSAVTAAAIDGTQDGVHLTAEIAVPSADGADPDGARAVSDGSTFVQALSRASTDRTLYWSHATNLLLDRTQARRGIADLVRQMTDEQEIRAAVRLCVVPEGRAADVLAKGEASDGQLPGFSLGDMLDSATDGGTAVDEPLYRVLDELHSAGIDPCLPYVALDEQQVTIGGTALFSGDTLVGSLGLEDTRLLCLLKNSCKQTVLAQEGHSISLSRASTTLEVRTKDCAPQYIVRFCALAASNSPHSIEAAGAELAHRMSALLSHLQQRNSDVLGLGRQWYRMDASAYAQAPDAWRTASVRVVVNLKPTQSPEGGTQ